MGRTCGGVTLHGKKNFANVVISGTRDGRISWIILWIRYNHKGLVRWPGGVRVRDGDGMTEAGVRVMRLLVLNLEEGRWAVFRRDKEMGSPIEHAERNAGLQTP